MRKTTILHLIIPSLIFFFNLFMIIYPKEIFGGAAAGLHLWFEKVVPSLLPFMITVNCLAAVDFPRVLGKMIQPLTLSLFNLTGEQAFPLAVGLTAGYPMGAKTTAQLYKTGKISKNTAHRLLLYSNNAGALFMIGTVGTGFFSDPKTGYFLVLCNYGAALLLAIISGLFYPSEKAVSCSVHVQKFTQKIFADAIADSINSILSIGCYIIIFSVLTELFGTLHIFDGISQFLDPLGLDKNISKAISVGIMEVTNACNMASCNTGKGSVLACAALIGWGGLSVHAQSIEFLEGTDLDIKYYFAGKILTAFLSLIIGSLLWKYFF